MSQLYDNFRPEDGDTTETCMHMHLIEVDQTEHVGILIFLAGTYIKVYLLYFEHSALVLVFGYFVKLISDFTL
jgi:hypothetical protein